MSDQLAATLLEFDATPGGARVRMRRRPWTVAEWLVVAVCVLIGGAIVGNGLARAVQTGGLPLSAGWGLVLLLLVALAFARGRFLPGELVLDTDRGVAIPPADSGYAPPPIALASVRTVVVHGPSEADPLTGSPPARRLMLRFDAPPGAPDRWLLWSIATDRKRVYAAAEALRRRLRDLGAPAEVE